MIEDTSRAPVPPEVRQSAWYMEFRDIQRRCEEQLKLEWDDFQHEASAAAASEDAEQTPPRESA